MADGPWWAVAVGRGTALKAQVQGPSATQPTPGFAGASFQIVGAQHGYPDKAVATEAAGIYNAGGLLPDDPSKAAVDKAKTTQPTDPNSSDAIKNRTSQAGGTAGSIPNPLTALNPFAPLAGIAGGIRAFYDALTDGKMWRSLGWLGLGLLMIFGGAMWFLRKPIEEAIGTVAGAAVKAP